MNKITWFLIFAWVTILIVVAYPNFTKAQGVICDERQKILEGLEKSFGEKITEQGVDDGLLVIITVNYEGKWSFLMTPKNKPNIFCVPATGTSWTQDSGSSKGVTYNGSILTINYEENGDWQMIYFDKHTGQMQKVTTGNGWERIIHQ